MDRTTGPVDSPGKSVEVVPYRDEWPALFEAERSALADAAGPVARSIEHIGSTAVPGLSSKPTIDILMVVDAPEAFLSRLRAVEAAGYEYRAGSFAKSPDHLFLRKVVDGQRISHLHVLPTGSPEIAEYRLFLDALRSDARLAARYEQLKLDLAAKYADDRMRYVSEKEAWVSDTLGSLSAGRGSDRTVYGRIGKGYAGQRIPEPTWERQIQTALGDARSVLNLGAGTGNYEPTDRFVLAVEPSSTMVAQRRNANPTVRGVAEQLPVRDGVFDAGLAVFTVHHWTDPAKGLREMRRTTRRQVLVVYEPLIAHGFWLVDYFPEIPLASVEAKAPTPDRVGEHLNVVDVQTMWIPHDCTDGVTAAHWRRPDAYLDPAVQQSMSSLALLPEPVLARGAAELAADLNDGTWLARNGHLLDQDKADYGYRLVVAQD